MCWLNLLPKGFVQTHPYPWLHSISPHSIPASNSCNSIPSCRQFPFRKDKNRLESTEESITSLILYYFSSGNIFFVFLFKLGELMSIVKVQFPTSALHHYVKSLE